MRQRFPQVDVDADALLVQVGCWTSAEVTAAIDLPLKTLTYRTGFRSDARMRKAFRRRFPLSPRDCRARIEFEDLVEDHRAVSSFGV
ncbi:hypothetical protein Q4543_22445 [Salipiger sp. 1_MG-2023]|uniref:hypothetical protein n=1 Tax=Salipiger sp. 1_MG-2023 TaxID=3062665 RepID=UPI0026E1ECCE|nr:hypothetical protein [Salipiger sp. 1_MG-2023]MDO6588260.1 hypothetical protein [Salipiger sp. 1_MG-2023]